MSNEVELKNAVKVRTAMEQYQDTVYLNITRQINDECQAILSDDMGSEFVENCGRDLAGEVIRGCFDTTDYNITVDQLAKRILTFTYENDYDPISNAGVDDQILKNVYAQGDNENRDFFKKGFQNIGITLPENSVEHITRVLIDVNQEKLFEKETYIDSRGREKTRYKDYKMIKAGKDAYVESAKTKNGNIVDEYTGQEGDYRYDKNGVKYRNAETDHDQSVNAAKVNSRYTTDKGKEELKQYFNSPDNFAMMHKKANESKGDVRVYDKDGNDITHRATPKQIADAVCQRWESAGNEKTKKDLKDHGYLDEEGKVPKSVRKTLEENIRHSQNGESKIILKHTMHKEIANDALDLTKKSFGKIIAGQIIYYAAPPLVYEVKGILKNKNISIDNALEKLSESAKRIGKYVLSKLKNIFENIAFNSLKKFIKAFMDILINTVKATVKKIMKMAKNLVISTVDAIRIIADKNSTKSEKANAVCNLYAGTITTCVVDVLFELAADSLHIPEPFDDIIFGPLQILATVVCTNFTMLVLKKLDLFNVEFGFKMSQIRKLFAESKTAIEEAYENSQYLADEEIKKIIENAKQQSREIYENLSEFDPRKDSARGELEKINRMFSMNIDFEKEWLTFIGIPI